MIRTKFMAEVRCESGTYLKEHHETRQQAQVWADKEAADVQRWIDDDALPDLRQHNPDAERWEPEIEITCVEYMVGDDDISGDEVAQEIVEAAIASGMTRWPAPRQEGSPRADRPYRLLFADSPTRRHWDPIQLEDSEQMLKWFVAHNIHYPRAAGLRRLRCRHGEHENVVDQRRLEYYNAGAKPLAEAKAKLAAIERDLVAAREALALAEIGERMAETRRDDNIRWHAEAMARRPSV